MCLAEALLRIPDNATRDRLIADKISEGNWKSHLNNSPSLFVNAATGGLVVTGKLVGTVDEGGLGTALTQCQIVFTATTLIGVTRNSDTGTWIGL